MKLTIDQYLERHGLRPYELARRIWVEKNGSVNHLSNQHLHFKRKSGWMIEVKGDEVVLYNPANPGRKLYGEWRA